MGNEVKTRLLGEPYGTATAKLRKAILFKLAQMAGLTGCYRCGEEIVNIEDFTIEHKESWMRSENPIEAFHDLNNIAFSHLSCNVGAAYKYKKYATPSDRLTSL